MNRKKLKANTVTDEQGRQRFHGAFTGGFSAGYYNTVGSVEGFKPSSFISSRSNRAPVIHQKKNDFADAEDGLLGGMLSAKKEFDTFDREARSAVLKNAEASARGSVIPGPIPAELIVPSAQSIGKRLLMKMGWREGQGVGARRRSQLCDTKIAAIDGTPSTASITAEDKRFSAALPVGALDATGHVTFAPVNTADEARMPQPKGNLYGLGYDPQIDKPNMSGFHDLDSTSNRGKGVYRMDDVVGGARGEKNYLDASGARVGSRIQRGLTGFALDDEDDDVYDYDNSILPSRKYYDSDKDKQNSRKEHNHDIGNLEEVVVDDDEAVSAVSRPRGTFSTAISSWLNDSTAGVSTVRTTQRCPSDGRPPLPGYILATLSSDTSHHNEDMSHADGSTSIQRVLPVHYAPPDPPRGYIPRPPCTEQSRSTVVLKADGTPAEVKLDNRTSSISEEVRRRQRWGHKEGAATIRARLLDDSAATATNGQQPSLFDLIGADGRERIRAAIAIRDQKQSFEEAINRDHQRTEALQQKLLHEATTTASLLPERPMLTSESVLKSAFAGVSSAFKSRFVTASSAGASGSEKSQTAGVQDQLANKPGLKTAEEHRATTASATLTTSEEKSSELTEAKKQLSIQQNLETRRKIIPKRTTTMWAPAPLLCKRFHAPVPTGNYIVNNSRAAASPGIPTGSCGPTTSNSIRPTIASAVCGDKAMLASLGISNIIEDKGGALSTDDVVRLQEKETVTSTAADERDISSEEEDDDDSRRPQKPPMSLFKSIFADSSDDDEEDDEEEEEERQQKEEKVEDSFQDKRKSSSSAEKQEHDYKSQSHIAPASSAHTSAISRHDKGNLTHKTDGTDSADETAGSECVGDTDDDNDEDEDVMHADKASSASTAHRGDATVNSVTTNYVSVNYIREHYSTSTPTNEGVNSPTDNIPEPGTGRIIFRRRVPRVVPSTPGDAEKGPSSLLGEDTHQRVGAPGGGVVAFGEAVVVRAKEKRMHGLASCTSTTVKAVKRRWIDDKYNSSGDDDYTPKKYEEKGWDSSGKGGGNANSQCNEIAASSTTLTVEQQKQKQKQYPSLQQPGRSHDSENGSCKNNDDLAATNRQCSSVNHGEGNDDPHSLERFLASVIRPVPISAVSTQTSGTLSAASTDTITFGIGSNILKVDHTAEEKMDDDVDDDSGQLYKKRKDGKRSSNKEEEEEVERKKRKKKEDKKKGKDDKKTKKKNKKEKKKEKHTKTRHKRRTKVDDKQHHKHHKHHQHDSADGHRSSGSERDSCSDDDSYDSSESDSS